MKDTKITISMPIVVNVEDDTISFRASVTVPVVDDVQAMINYAVNSILEQHNEKAHDATFKMVERRVTQAFKDGGWL